MSAPRVGVSHDARRVSARGRGCWLFVFQSAFNRGQGQAGVFAIRRGFPCPPPLAYWRGVLPAGLMSVSPDSPRLSPQPVAVQVKAAPLAGGAGDDIRPRRQQRARYISRAPRALSRFVTPCGAGAGTSCHGHGETPVGGKPANTTPPALHARACVACSCSFLKVHAPVGAGAGFRLPPVAGHR